MSIYRYIERERDKEREKEREGETTHTSPGGIPAASSPFTTSNTASASAELYRDTPSAVSRP